MNISKKIKLFPICLSLILILITTFNNGKIIFPIDDAYIYFQQSYLFSKGNFLYYSYNEEHANACTSFIYYLIYTFFWLIANLFDLDLKNKIQLVSVFNLLLNFLFLYLYLNIIQKLFFSLKEKNESIKFAIIVSVVPVYYVFFIGLETGLTTLIIILQFYFIYKGEKNLFLVTSIIASLNRPENLVLNLILIIIFLILNPKIKKKELFLLLLLFISLFAVPLINYWGYSEIKTNSAARVGWGFGNILRLPGNIYDFIGSIYQNPDFLDQKFDRFFISIKFLLNLLFFYAILKIVFKIYKTFSYPFNKEYFFIFLEEIRTTYRFEFLSIIFIIFYSFTPLTLGFTGEWSRYVAPVIPLLLILCFRLFDPTKLVLYFFLTLNVITYPFYLVSNLNSTHIIKKIHVDLASKVKMITKNTDITATTAAGYLSLFVNGKIIDVYGLGTARYSVLNKNDISSVYEQIKKEGFTYLLTFDYDDEAKTFMDLGHFKKALPNANFKTIQKESVKNPSDGNMMNFSLIRVY